MKRSIRIALQLLASQLEVLNSIDVYDLTHQDPDTMVWLWDRKTGDFEKGGKYHIALADKITKKHKLGNTPEEIDSANEDMLDTSIRGYYFPSLKQIAIYPIKSGSRRYVDATSSILNQVAQKLHAGKDVTGIAIQDQYYVEV